MFRDHFGSRESAPLVQPLRLSQDDIMEKRSDGRKNLELRPIFMKVGVLNQSSGSAYLEIGNTKIAASVRSPSMSMDAFSATASLKVEVKYAEYSNTKLKKAERFGEQTPNEAFMAQVVKEAVEPAIMLENYPKCDIECYLKVLEEGGGVISAAVLALSLALCDAGIMMTDIPTASSSVVIGGEVRADPLLLEEQVSSATVFMSILPKSRKIMSFSQQGSLTEEEAALSMDVCMDTANQVYMIMRNCLAENVEGLLK
eukprot:TRINITY_DN41483_c0_g1_i1.p1 TRINITY_DN41483_c0_g1~~TRINITY_DN41483_c0_g1_i1.p1  ORF type:complete len:257 (-),score=37.46 TRINITY_DN41483_c0_g1_i1:4-774(-)